MDRNGGQAGMFFENPEVRSVIQNWTLDPIRFSQGGCSDAFPKAVSGQLRGPGRWIDLSFVRVGNNTDGAPIFGMRNSHSLTTYPGRIVVIPQIATTATSRPEALTSCSMSSGSLVRIVAFCRRAVVTTTASTTSDVLVMPNSRPASCASVSPRGTTTHPVKKRRSWACCGDRLTWTTTGAGTNGTTPSSKRALCSAHARRSFLSAATRTAAS